MKAANVFAELTQVIVDSGIETLLLPASREKLSGIIKTARESGEEALAELLENLQADYLSVEKHAGPLLLAGRKEELYGFYSFFSAYEKEYWRLTEKEPQ